MSTTDKGSKPGPITQQPVQFSNIVGTRSTPATQRRESYASDTSRTSEFPGRAWMEKGRVSTKDFPSERNSAISKDESKCYSENPTDSTPPIERTVSSQWQAGPPASVHSAGDEVTYPEGGLRAWLVVLGSLCGMLAGFGFMNTIGVFHTYLTENQLRGYSESTIGWIFSFYVFLAFFGGIQIGPIFDAKGPFWLITSGSVLLIAATMLLGLCTQYWHFMLTIGLMAGAGTSLIFTPSVSAVGHFFLVKRGAATGIAAMGGAIGGVIFPLMLQDLIPKIGFAWATRIMGFIFIALCAVAMLLVRSRLPPKVGGTIMPSFTVFRDPAFALVTAGTWFMEFALFIPITYLATFALETHVDNAERFGPQLLAILNAGSALGRWLPGVFADRIGRYNSMILMLGLCTVTTLALWLPASLLTSEEGNPHPAMKPLLIVYALFFGFASGSNISLTPVCVGQLCDTQEYGRYYASCYTVVAIGTLTGIPIGGALIEACGGSYYGVVIFTGASYVVSLITFVAARVMKAGTHIRVMY